MVEVKRQRTRYTCIDVVMEVRGTKDDVGGDVLVDDRETKDDERGVVVEDKETKDDERWGRWGGGSCGGRQRDKRRRTRVWTLWWKGERQRTTKGGTQRDKG